MIVEFQRNWEEQYKFKTSEQLQSVIDKRNTRNEKNAQTQRERNTTADMDETRVDGDDDDEVGYSEDDHGEDEDGAGSGDDGTASHSKRRQDRIFYFTTGAVKRTSSKEDGNLTATCQVGGHAQCSNIISMPNGGTQGVSQHFLKYNADLNVRIRDLKVLPGPGRNPRDFMTLLNHVAPRTQEQRPTILDTLNRAVARGDKLFTVTDSRQALHCHRLSTLIDKTTLFINSWLIRL
jgi:hypothetical protein